MSNKESPPPVTTRRPRRRLLALAGFMVIALIAGLVVYPYYRSYVAPWEQAVLRVNDTTFNMRYYFNRFRLYAQGSQDDKSTLMIQMLMDMQNQELIRQEAMKRGLGVSEEELTREIKRQVLPADAAESEFRDRYRSLLQELRLSEKDHREMVKMDLLVQKLREKLGEELPTSAEQVRVHAIVVDSPEKAEEIKARLNQGEDFATLAKNESLDYQSRDNGGDLGWLPREVNESTATTQVHALGLLVKAQDEAKAARARIEAGENFARVAGEVSLDQASKEKGGDLGWFMKGFMGARFDDPVFEMEVGALSSPLETEEGFWIVKVLGKTLEGKLIDDIAFSLPIGEVSPMLAVESRYYLLKVSERAASRPLEEEHRESFKDKALKRWVEETAEKGRMEGWVRWSWDSEKYAWVMDHLE